jgi:putative phosphoesterase
MIKSIGVIGDIHGEVEELQATLDFLSKRPLDALLCTGDIVTGEGDASRCCEILAGAGVLCVRGNHDRWFLDQTTPAHERAVGEDEVAPAAKAFLAALPVTRGFETPAGRALLCHGLGDDDMAGVFPGDRGVALESNHRLHAMVMQADYPVVINGHTHQRMARNIEGVTIINAGTLRNWQQPCFLTIDFADGIVQFYEIGQKTAVTAGVACHIPSWC